MNRRIIKVGLWLGFIVGLLLMVVQIVVELPLLIVEKLKQQKDSKKN